MVIDVPVVMLIAVVFSDLTPERPQFLLHLVKLRIEFTICQLLNTLSLPVQIV